MPIAWIEKKVSQRVKTWAYNNLLSGDVVFAGDRGKQGYPTVAELMVTDEDAERFAPDIDEAVTVIMYHRDLKPIDDKSAIYPIDEIVFHVECCGLSGVL